MNKIKWTLPAILALFSLTAFVADNALAHDTVNTLLFQISSANLSTGPIQSERETLLRQGIPIIFIVLLGMGGVFRTVLGRFAGAVVAGGITGFVAWLLVGTLGLSLLAGILALLVTLFSGGMRGMERGFYGGSGGFSSNALDDDDSSFSGDVTSGKW